MAPSFEDILSKEENDCSDYANKYAVRKRRQISSK